MNFFSNWLLVLINYPSIQTLFRQKEPGGGICVFRHFFFNLILDTGCFPKLWGNNVVTPIQKSDPTTIPRNYRGISISNTLYKQSGVINKRLNEWTEDNGKINKSQSAFRKGYFAVDNIFVCNQWSRTSSELILYTYTS